MSKHFDQYRDKVELHFRNLSANEPRNVITIIWEEDQADICLSDESITKLKTVVSEINTTDNLRIDVVKVISEETI